jgi:hypothetical protein
VCSRLESGLSLQEQPANVWGNYIFEKTSNRCRRMEAIKCHRLPRDEGRPVDISAPQFAEWALRNIGSGLPRHPSGAKSGCDLWATRSSMSCYQPKLSQHSCSHCRLDGQVAHCRESFFRPCYRGLCGQRCCPLRSEFRFCIADRLEISHTVAFEIRNRRIAVQ